MCHKHAQICVQLVNTFHMLEAKETQNSQNKNKLMLKRHSSNKTKIVSNSYRRNTCHLYMG